ncbi:MAG: M20 family metallopeptidase [Thermoanaerobaculia bacterium]
MPSHTTSGALPGGHPLPDELLAAARELLPWMIEVRRDLHRHPELGLEEHRTSARIQEHLGELGIPFVAGLAGTGVLGTIAGAGGGRTVALRADIDALPLQDAKEVPYRSEIAGRMHACGHDVHTTVLLGAARLLRDRLGATPGTVKLIFQPAEETVGGARLLVEQGVLDDPRVEAIFGLHVDPGLPVGHFGLKYGQRNASSDDLAIAIHGRSCHGAYPAAGVDAIVVAAQVISALQTIVSRNVDARASAVITIGTIRGGTQGNIVAPLVEMVGTVRTLDRSVRELVLRRAKEVAEGVAAGFGARAEVRIDPSFDPVINDDAMVDVVRASAARLVGEERITVFDRPNMGVEDFGFYLTHVPGAFYSLGVRNDERGIVHPVHNDRFDVDEECLAWGATLQAMNALAVLER